MMGKPLLPKKKKWRQNTTVTLFSFGFLDNCRRDLWAALQRW